MHKPIVMFGDTRSFENIALLSARKWGRMFGPNRRHHSHLSAGGSTTARSRRGKMPDSRMG